jgi:hypothetical protein
MHELISRSEHLPINRLIAVVLGLSNPVSDMLMFAFLCKLSYWGTHLRSNPLERASLQSISVHMWQDISFFNFSSKQALWVLRGYWLVRT